MLVCLRVLSLNDVVTSEGGFFMALTNLEIKRAEIKAKASKLSDGVCSFGLARRQAGCGGGHTGIKANKSS